ncbi:MAG: hypothetical protein M3Y17_07415 [Actinomycetota bacterium]|nr:hypothetical protein [Actinomycetota bacterium]
MLIMPPGHARAIGVQRELRRREKWMLGAVLGVVAALIVAVAIAVLTPGHTSAHGCVDVVIPYSTGGQELYRCGAGARTLCALVGAPRGYSGPVARDVADECRKAGVRIGP